MNLHGMDLHGLGSMDSYAMSLPVVVLGDLETKGLLDSLEALLECVADRLCLILDPGPGVLEDILREDL